MNKVAIVRLVDICFLAFLLGVLAATGWAAVPATALTTAPAAYTGRVFGPGDKPVAGARVALYDWAVASATSAALNAPPVQTVTTDSAGRFQLPRPSQTFHLVVQAPGCGLWVLSSTLADEDTEPREIYLKAPASVRVHLIGTDGKPLAGVRAGLVNLRPENEAVYGGGGVLPEELVQRFAKTSDQNGECVFDDLPQRANLSVRIIDPRYMPSSDGSVATAGPGIAESAPICVSKGVIVEGRVIRSDTGAPVAGVRVNDFVTYKVGSSMSSGTVTDAAGKFFFGQRYAGEHTLSTFVPPPLNAQLTGTKSDPQTLAAGQHVAGMELQLVKAALIHGTARVSGAGSPIAGATIEISNSSGGSMLDTNTTITGADGTYAFQVIPGMYTLRIRDLAKQGLLIPRPNGREAIANIGQDASVGFYCPPNPSPGVKGRLHDAQGRPFVGATVTALPQRSGRGGTMDKVVEEKEEAGGTTTTDANGGFTIPFVTDRAVLIVRQAEKQEVLRFAQPATIDATHRDLDLTVIPTPKGTLAVHVVDPSGKPFAEVPVTVSWIIRDELFASHGKAGLTGPDGTFRVADLPKDFKYTVNVGGRGYSRAQSDVNIQAGQETAVGPLSVSRADSFITGIVVDDHNTPIPGAILHGSGPGFDDPTPRTDMEGRFRIDNVVAGTKVAFRVWVDRVDGHPDGYSIPAGTSDNVVIFDPNAPPAPRAPVREGPRFGGGLFR